MFPLLSSGGSATQALLQRTAEAEQEGALAELADVLRLHHLVLAMMPGTRQPSPWYTPY